MKGVGLEIERRYVFFSLSVLFIISTVFTDFWGIGISDFGMLIGDIGTLLMTVLIIYFILSNWNEKNARKLSHQNNIIVFMMVMAVAFQLYGYYRDLNTQYSVSNVQVILGLVLAILNRYI